MNLIEALEDHYKKYWGNHYNYLKGHKGPVEDLGANFRVLEFAPNELWHTWVYATVGMSLKGEPIELHLISRKQDSSIVELLSAISHYHITGSALGLGHTVSFGRSWQDNSICDYGFISLPYLFGPELEVFEFDRKTIRCLWLIPITKEEVEYRKQKGTEAMEILFEEQAIDYANPNRKSLM